MTQFPNSPSVGDKVTFNDATYEWDGNRWKSLGAIAVGPIGPTGPIGVTGQDGSGGGVSAGAGMTLAGSTLGIDPTAVIHVAGVSSDGGITLGGEYLRWSSNDSIRSSGGVFRFYASGTNVLNMTPSLLDMKKAINVEGLAHFEAGISSDIGITCGGTIATDNFRGVNSATVIEMDRGGAGAGTIGFNPGGNFAAQFTPTSFYHGGNLTNEGTGLFNQLLTATNGIKANGLIHTAAGISMDAAGITFPDGTFQSSAGGGGGGGTGPTGPTGGNGPAGSTGPTGSGIGPTVTVTGGTGGPDASWISSAATGDFYIEVVN